MQAQPALTGNTPATAVLIEHCSSVRAQFGGPCPTTLVPKHQAHQLHMSAVVHSAHACKATASLVCGVLNDQGVRGYLSQKRTTMVNAAIGAVHGDSPSKCCRPPSRARRPTCIHSRIERMQVNEGAYVGLQRGASHMNRDVNGFAHGLYTKSLSQLWKHLELRKRTPGSVVKYK